MQAVVQRECHYTEEKTETMRLHLGVKILVLGSLN